MSVLMKIIMHGISGKVQKTPQPEKISFIHRIINSLMNST